MSLKKINLFVYLILYLPPLTLTVPQLDRTDCFVIRKPTIRLSSHQIWRCGGNAATFFCFVFFHSFSLRPAAVFQQLARTIAADFRGHWSWGRPNFLASFWQSGSCRGLSRTPDVKRYATQRHTVDPGVLVTWNSAVILFIRTCGRAAVQPKCSAGN